MHKLAVRCFLMCCLACHLAWSFPCLAVAEPELSCPEQVDEGSAFVVRVRYEKPFASAELNWLGRDISLEPSDAGEGYEAYALLGIGMRDKLSGSSFPVRVLVDSGGQPHLLTCSVARTPKDFPEQRLNVDKQYVDISEENLARHRLEKKAINKALGTVSEAALWDCPMVRPVPGVVTSPFGLRRFFNDQPRNPHSGVDLDGEEGDHVLAAFSGRVLLAAEHFFAGKSVYIDHGQGVISVYIHLSSILVKGGQEVDAGQVIGLVGETGRVTGPHLHLGLSILGQRIDPLTVGPAVEELCW